MNVPGYVGLCTRWCRVDVFLSRDRVRVEGKVGNRHYLTAAWPPKMQQRFSRSLFPHLTAEDVVMIPWVFGCPVCPLKMQWWDFECLADFWRWSDNSAAPFYLWRCSDDCMCVWWPRLTSDDAVMILQVFSCPIWPLKISPNVVLCGWLGLKHQLIN